MTSLLLAAALLLEVPATDTSVAFDPFLYAVGVCPVQSGLRAWSVIWHGGSELPEDQAVALGRVFKHLEGPDVDACLTRMVESDPDALATVQKMVRAPGAAPEAMDAVRKVWIRHGVDAAVREVAATGTRGPAVARLLAACARLQTDKESLAH